MANLGAMIGAGLGQGVSGLSGVPVDGGVGIRRLLGDGLSQGASSLGSPIPDTLGGNDVPPTLPPASGPPPSQVLGSPGLGIGAGSPSMFDTVKAPAGIGPAPTMQSPPASPDVLTDALRVAKDAVINSQGDVKKALSDLIAKSQAPPAKKGASFGTRDLLWAVPMLIAAFGAATGHGDAGRNMGDLATGIGAGALNGKVQEAARTNENATNAWAYGENQLKVRADSAQQTMQMALSHLNMLENEWYRQGMLGNKAVVEQGKNDRSANTQETRKEIAGMNNDTKRYGIDQNQGGGALAQSKIGLNDTQQAYIQGPKTDLTKSQTGVNDWRSQILQQQLAFHKDYDPKLVARVTKQIADIAATTGLKNEQQQLLVQKVADFPLEQQAKRADIYSRIAKRQATGSGGDGMSDAEAKSLFNMNEEVLKGYAKRQSDILQSNPLTPDEIDKAKSIVAENDQLRARFSAKMNQPAAAAKPGTYSPDKVREANQMVQDALATGKINQNQANKAWNEIKRLSSGQ